jgi:protein required for attachment to host cells
MEQIIRTGKTKNLIVVAPPRTLAELRKEASHQEMDVIAA